jgi:hypothetical protein
MLFIKKYKTPVEIAISAILKALKRSLPPQNGIHSGKLPLEGKNRTYLQRHETKFHKVD